MALAAVAHDERQRIAARRGVGRVEAVGVVADPVERPAGVGDVDPGALVLAVDLVDRVADARGQGDPLGELVGALGVEADVGEIELGLGIGEVAAGGHGLERRRALERLEIGAADILRGIAARPAERLGRFIIGARLPGEPAVAGVALELELLGEGRLRGVVLRPRGIEQDIGEGHPARGVVEERLAGLGAEVVAVEAEAGPLAEFAVAGDVLDAEGVADLPGRGVYHLPLLEVDVGIGVRHVDVEQRIPARGGPSDLVAGGAGRGRGADVRGIREGGEVEQRIARI